MAPVIRDLSTPRSRPEVLRIVRALPGAVTGRRIPTGWGAVSRKLSVRVGLEILRLIHEAFLVKSRGGTDEAGLRWLPLSPVTRDRRRFLLSKKKPVRPLSLNILEETGRLKESLKPATGPESATDAPFPVTQQIFRVRQGSVTIGTKRPWAWTHHEGKGRVPPRRLWPPSSRWPSRWWQLLRSQVIRGVLGMVQQGFKV